MILRPVDTDDPQRYSPPYPLSAVGGRQAPPAEHATVPASGIEARAELFQSHAFLNVGEMLRSFDTSFTDRHFYQSLDDGVMFEEYVSHQLRVFYYSNSQGRDELGVCWRDHATEQAHDHARLLELTHQLTNLLGGGTNFRLEERPGQGPSKEQHKGVAQ